ncbi:protein-disulfide reductase DsbD [Candidatus Symbiopectobacterium sp. NZEC127]|uniref:protein-disulfide reductase DsbD n=1 Tax=Candidatus Symbiopectobacterium sp. NZEC127 TaxID=2820472 RepID=UPI002225D112|nr:protein-disulfide reductase DsbD [Candidatus Symbiopectobacterium sp. NZEC127]MCW2486461.1 protein-disulfide reductase DsbD [Candidatus Symbiopectobacterium sp. NZEC127]
MANRILTLILLLSTLICPQLAGASLFAPSSPVQNSRFLTVDRAFAFDFQQQQETLTLRWQIHPGYYLYRDKISLAPGQAVLGDMSLPAGLPHKDDFFGEVAIFRDSLTVTVPITQSTAGATVRVTYQGCADAGFCYPPETREIPLSAVTAGHQPTPSDRAPTATTPVAPAQLPFSPLWALLIGIGVAFTPCVLPMYPLISGLILGRKQQLSTRRTLLLAFTYVQGMALTYTLLGVIIAAAGLRFQAALQHPAVLIGLSLLFIALALSMFGLYNLQMPSALQTRLALWSNRQQSGSLGGVFCMGALAGLICSPCTTAPLSAILLYIAQSGNSVAGGGILYLYALGMGLPLIAVTLFGNRFLPRSGPWMQHIKTAFGFVILALPVFLLERVVGDIWGARLWSLLIISFLSWLIILGLRSHWRGMRLIQLLLLIGAVTAARPLQEWLMPSSSQASTAHTSTLPFTQVHHLEGLNQSLTSSQRPAMLDLYADWCVACKEFEKYTFSDAAVKQALAGFQLLQADVTANNAQQNALLKKFQVMGLPTILFFDSNGREIPDSRITGFMNAEAFRAHLQKLGQ